ncbi:MAG: hypothetical protein GC153_13435 [Alphaproteobacteria bacterium]|nr:hypothetical protein [Alphaproteobacteria bacterium]
MILSRVIEHVKRRHWTAVFLDFVIVVAGVFVATQVSNWNTAQADARLGHEYVKRLSHDLKADLVYVRAEVGYYRDVIKSIEKADKLLDETDPDPRALVVNAYRASELTYSAPVRATWDQIVSSGHLDLLPSMAADSRLSAYYAFNVALDIYQEGLKSEYRRTVRRIIPISMQTEMRAKCSDVRTEWGDIVGFVKDCAFEADPAALKRVADALMRDPDVAADLRNQYSFILSAVLNLEGVENILEDALAALGADPSGAEKSAP